MGKGPKATEHNVVKQLDYTISTGSGGVSGKKSSQSDKCAISFSFEASIVSAMATRILVSAGVVLALASNSKDIDVYIDGLANSYIYTGTNTSLLISCMKQGYIYEGVVTKVKHGKSNITVSCDISGHTK